MRREIVLQDGWYVKQFDEAAIEPAWLMAAAEHPDETWLTAQMPAQVHEILFADGQISDPHLSKNAAESTWVGEKDWAYVCHFQSPQMSEGPVFLRFKGLDTLATAYLNGVQIGEYDNMFRVYCAEVRTLLAPAGQTNVLLIHFHSPLRAIASVRQPPEHVGVIDRTHYLRKLKGDFITYLGATPHFCKVGVYADVLLDIPDVAWLDDVWVRSVLAPDRESARLNVTVEAGGVQSQLDWTLTDPKDARIAQGTHDMDDCIFTIELDHPELWWPFTHGVPHLYRLEVCLRVGDRVCDKRTVRIGIRDIRLELEDEATAEPRFRFVINGQPIFLQGALMCPLEGMTHRWQPERWEHLLELAVGAHMNVLRDWGGANVFGDSFYERCDEHGILVWQDFMFDYGFYPDDDPAFNDNLRQEFEGIVRRLRNHPSLLMYCGGNENPMGFDFAGSNRKAIGPKIYEEIAPEVCARLDPDRIYYPNSPYYGAVPNWPLAGDWHDYSFRYFLHKASVPTFGSEIGRASTPTYQSMTRFLSEEELWPQGFVAQVPAPGEIPWPPMWKYRSAGDTLESIGPVEDYADPQNARDLVRVVGTAHGEYLQRRIERERRGVPDGAAAGSRRCWGHMICRFNDAWPVIHWGLVDYYLDPKIAYYFVRRAFAPVLVSFERTPDDLYVWVINDSAKPVRGLLTVQTMTWEGKLRAEMSVEVDVAPGQAQRSLDTLSMGRVSRRHEFLLARLDGLEATHCVDTERHLNLPQANVALTVTGGRLRISTDVFARQILLEADGVSGAVLEDNYFDMAPGCSREIAIVHSAGAKSITMRCVNASTVTVAL